MRKLMIKQLERLAAEHADQFIASMMVSTKSIIDMAEYVRGLERRAEAAEERCTLTGHDMDTVRYRNGLLEIKITQLEAKIKEQDELIYSMQETVYRYSGPVPAVNLAALVPAERFVDVMNENMDDVSLAEDIGFNKCRAAILRNIEEANIPAAKMGSVADIEVQAGSEEEKPE